MIDNIKRLSEVVVSAASIPLVVIYAIAPESSLKSIFARFAVPATSPIWLDNSQSDNTFINRSKHGISNIICLIRTHSKSI